MMSSGRHGHCYNLKETGLLGERTPPHRWLQCKTEIQSEVSVSEDEASNSKIQQTLSATPPPLPGYIRTPIS